MYIEDYKFTTTAGIVNLHPTKGTHWVMFSNQIYFDSCGFASPVNIEKILITNQINSGIYSEFKIQKIDSFCAVY